MKNFFLKLLGSETGVSSRRFIALMMVPSYFIGSLMSVIYGVLYDRFNFFVGGMVSGGVLIFIAFFSLTWEHIIKILKNFKLNKNDKNNINNDFNDI